MGFTQNQVEKSINSVKINHWKKIFYAEKCAEKISGSTEKSSEFTLEDLSGYTEKLSEHAGNLSESTENFQWCHLKKQVTPHKIWVNYAQKWNFSSVKKRWGIQRKINRF